MLADYVPTCRLRLRTERFLFTGLGAEYGLSDSLDGDAPSGGVSLGYRPGGIEHLVANSES